MHTVRNTFVITALLLAGGACGSTKEEAPAGGAPAAQGDKPAPKAPAKAGGVELKAMAVAAGDGVSCALMEDGTARCWGRGDVGELGTGRVEGDSVTPVAVPGVSGAKRLAVGGDPGDSGDLACAHDGGGKATCWGLVRMIPAPAPADAPKPGEIPGLAGATQLVFGGGQGLALFPDGTVKGWGGNVFNALGVGDGVDVDDAALTPIPGIADAVAVGSGQNHGCAVHKDGSVTCWGYSRKKMNPTKIEGIADAEQITGAAGGSDTCVVTKGKAVSCWGEYDLKPKPVEGLTDVVGITARTHFCAVKGDGTAWCWGGNRRGQLGTGAAGSDANKPQQVTGLTDAVAISAGAQTTCALRKTGQVACWGYNNHGQLGDGTLVDRAEPVEVKHLNAKALPAPAAPTEVQQAATRQAFDGLPEGCTHAGTLDGRFKTFEGAFPVVSAYAKDEGGKGLTYTVRLANYQYDPGDWGPPRGSQLRLSLRFAKVDLQKNKTPLPVVPGVYTQDTKQDQLVYASMADRASDGYVLSDLSLTEGLKAGEVELTKLGDGWVCGELRLQTKSSKFAGKFAAKLVEK